MLSGGAGNDQLIGGNGNDILNGGAGADHFIFDFKPSAYNNIDRIEDFSESAGDKIVLDTRFSQPSIQRIFPPEISCWAQRLWIRTTA